MEEKAKLTTIIVMAVILIAGGIVIPSVFRPPPLPEVIAMSGKTEKMRYSAKNAYILFTGGISGNTAHSDTSIGLDYVAGIKAAFGVDAVLIDAGGFSTSSDLADNGTIQDIMRSAGYNYAVPGVTEFAIPGNLEAMTKRLSFQLISANITKGGQPALPPTVTRTLSNRIKIGIIGLTAPQTAQIYPSRTAGYGFSENLADLTVSYAESLRDQDCDIIVVLAHLNFEDSTAIADSAGSLIDAVITGYSGLSPQNSVLQNGVWIVGTGSEQDYCVGLLRFSRSGSKFKVDPFYITREFALEKYAPVADVTDRINEYRTFY